MKEGNDTEPVGAQHTDADAETRMTWTVARILEATWLQHISACFVRQSFAKVTQVAIVRVLFAPDAKRAHLLN